MMKRLLVTLGIIIGVLVLLVAGYLVFMSLQMRDMHTLETGQVTDHIYALKDSYVNAYVIGSADSGYILIDAGNKSKNIKAALASLNIDPARVKAIFLTHTDGDHVGAIPFFPAAEIFISRQEEQLINGKTSRFFVFGNKIDTKKYTLIDDDQLIRFPDLNIKCILSPGHTIGSMCYLVEDKYLFTGDVLKLVKGKAEEFHHFINMDSETDRESIDKLSRLKNVECIFTAHYGYSKDFGTAFKDWKK